MHIIINNNSMTPIAENEVLPSVRALSAELRISALTVKKAYDRLEEEGFVITVHGKGTYVAATDRQLALEARKKTVEDAFASAVQKASAVGFTKDDILEILKILLEDY